MQYFQVKVQFRTEDENGKVKKQNVAYLVDAQSVTEAEARTVEYLTAQGEEAFEVKAASESKIFNVISAGASEIE
jgi:Fe-S cluster assembly iron-binding protein IscA